MSISQNVKSLLTQKKLTQKDLSVHLGIGSSTVNNWLKLDRSIPAEFIIPICEFVGVSPYFLLTGNEKNSPANLSEDEVELLKYYKQLPEKEKIRLVSRAEAIADTYSELVPEPTPPMLAIKHSMYKVSAGTGERLSDSDDWDEIEIPDTPEARRADFCLTIYGNSMEPVYYDGDIVLVKQQNAVERGQIGIFVIEGCGYIKKFGGDRLISLNDQYDDIMFSDYDPDDIRCSGLVIGRV